MGETHMMSNLELSVVASLVDIPTRLLNMNASLNKDPKMVYISDLVNDYFS